MNRVAADLTGADGVHLRRGAEVPANAAISVVVMAIDSDPRAVEAVASLRTQGVAVEIIVVNTGAGTLRDMLVRETDHIVLLEARDRRLPGGTRNLGLAVATAEIIAFLAADCLATPNWVRQRIAAHGSGALAVASALRPVPRGDGTIGAVSWASHVLLHSRRLPECPPADALTYGLSYAQSLFRQFGQFREDLRIGEDTTFNGMLSAAGVVPHWDARIVTLHQYPTNLRPAALEMIERGKSLYAWQRAHTASPLRSSLSRVAGGLVLAYSAARHTRGDVRKALRRAAPLTIVLAMFYAYGTVQGSVAALKSRPTLVP